MTGQVAAIVVDYDSGEHLGTCVRSLLTDGASEVVVVENGSPGPARRVLAGLAVTFVDVAGNLGYGAGANRGVAASEDSSYVLVCNPDVTVRPGALAALVGALEDHRSWALVGPRILDPDGTPYPSVRRFPSVTDAAGHALLALFKPDNRFSARYHDSVGDVAREVDWVSGACLCARRQAFEELGGFDEDYFMFAEDMDLCFRAHEAGWGVGVAPDATVTHVVGVSRRHHPYRMLAAHHRSALRFEARRARGLERLALPAAACVLGLRFLVSVGDQVLRRRR